MLDEWQSSVDQGFGLIVLQVAVWLIHDQAVQWSSCGLF
jgi:thiol:disulfide interchange protein